jgi:hypothetical protein
VGKAPGVADRPASSAPRNEGTDSFPDEPQWVPVARAAELMGCTEEWLMDRCRDGRLPRRTASAEGPEFVVPLSTVRAFVACEITE